MKYYFISSKLKKRLKKSSCTALRTLLDNKLRTKSALKNPEPANGYIIEKYYQASGPRFIWRSKRVENKEMLILRDALLHDEYNSKYTSGTVANWDRMLHLTPDEEAELKEYYRSIKDQDDNEEVSLRPLTQAESNFLNSPLQINPELFSNTVYEKKGWLDYFVAKGDKYKANYGQALEDLILGNDNDESEWLSVAIPNDKEEVIAVYHQVRTEESGKKFHDWVLLGIVPKGTNLEEKYRDVLNPLDPEDARIGARRAYPFTMLEDKDYWQKMENDASSNMILSSEESDVIGRDPEYPMFISGRAGSGKSTVLQYLFAEIILRYLQSCMFEEDGNTLSMPVYLSYSESLIEKARELTESLFSHNHIYQKELENLDLNYREDVKPLINNGMFCVFDQLVRNLIATHNEEDLKKFNQGKRISFAKFKNLWEQKYLKVPKYKKYGPSLCWHIIKTYIKGWDSSKYLTPEDYNGIGRDNKTVADSTYKFVYDNIWSNWYSSLNDQGYWDDQDLVRFCLHPSDNPDDSCVEPSYSAVFCDESQDFTRIELELILGLSTLSHRDLVNAADVYKIPFIFVGDEFQTLSPTGFSWNSLRSFFNSELARHLKIATSEFTPTEPLQLVNNYRSTGAIVKLGNRLQLLRGARFDQPSKPQKPYFSDLGAPVLYFQEDAEVIRRLKSKNLILIVPADDGMTAEEYIANTPLVDVIEFYDNGIPKEITILNPAQAKGLDYDNVAIYGFGNECDHLKITRVKAALDATIDKDSESEKEIDARYHLNNAYVAVTRAKERLFIIDSHIDDSLWGVAIQKANSPEIQSKMIARLPDTHREEWDDSVLGYMVKGNLDDILDNGNTNWVEFIGSMEDKARKSQDCDLMRQAAARYKERGVDIGEHRCLGYVYEMKEQHEDAADEFLKSEMYNEAMRHLWLSIQKDNVGRILEKINRHAIHSDSRNALLASRIHKVGTSKTIAGTLKTIKDCLYDLSKGLNEESTDSKERSIRRILAEYLVNRIPKVGLDEKSELENISNFIKPFQSEGDVRIDVLISRLDEVNEYNQLIEVCERQKNKPYGKLYYKAKIELSKYPERLLYFDKAYDNWQERVFHEYRNNNTVNISSDTINFIIANAVMTCSDDKAEISKSAALVLTLDSNPELIYRFFEKTDKLGLTFNKNVLHLLLAIRHLNTEQLKQIIDSEGIEKSQDVTNSARDILEVMAKDYKFDDRLLRAGVSSYFNEKFRSKLKGILTTPYLLLLGNRMDERRQFLDSIHYFEWAEKQAHPEDKNLFSLLVLRNEELKDCNGNLDNFVPRVNRRRELNLGPTIDELDKKIQAEIIKAWQRIFRFVIDKMKEPTGRAEVNHTEQDSCNDIPQKPQEDISKSYQNDIRLTFEKKNSSVQNNVKESSMDTEVKTEEQESPHKIDYANLPESTFTYGELEITFNFQKGRLILFHQKLKQKLTVTAEGRIRDDEEFICLEDGRLELDGSLIDLSIHIYETEIILSQVNLNGVPTGLYIRFPRISK